jgi:hypothetical protein
VQFNNEILKIKAGSILEEKINLDPQHLKGVYTYPSFLCKKNTEENLYYHTSSTSISAVASHLKATSSLGLKLWKKPVLKMKVSPMVETS